MTGLAKLFALYRRVPSDDRPFCDRALESLSIRFEVDGGIDTIPREGPLVVVANHPFGAADGLVLLSLLNAVRPDVKVLANGWLRRIPELSTAIVAVDAFRSRRGIRGNAVALRRASRWVATGGALVVFPSGEVSHVEDPDGNVVDPPWNPAVASIVRHAAAGVVPVFVAGQNSRLFRRAGRVHARCRTALLGRELLRQAGRTIGVTVGPLISPARLAAFGDAAELTSYLRIRTYALSSRGAPSAIPGCRIAAAEPPEALARELAALDASQVLVRSGPFDVYVAAAAAIPAGLREIGRLRETAFRAAGEGAGRERDLDRFDVSYRHLFVWNRERREVAGAYRAGLSDEILPRDGANGLYTSTLFRYDDRLLQQIGPAIELGRAFVSPEYQKDYSPLLLLWKGIAAFVARKPRYRILFGPVSISNEYQSVSRQILARFLYATSYSASLGPFVEARNAPAFLRTRRDVRPVAGMMARTLADVGTLLSEIESDGKGVPVLLRQYMKLNARLLGFNVDPAFGNALDGLMLVDLADVDRAILSRYMGPDAAAAFLAHHGALVHTESRRAC